MRMVNGRLRLKVPRSKRLLLSSPYIFYIFFLTGFLIGPILMLSPNGLRASVPVGILIIQTSLFLFAVTQLSVFSAWYLLGHYVLDIDDQTVRSGRSIFNFGFLKTHNAEGLYRIRFNPMLNLNNRTYSNVGKVFIPGFYHLYLDYGLKGKRVLPMAIEEKQIRVMKEIIRTSFPHWYQMNHKTATMDIAIDPQKEIEMLKSKI